MRASDEEAVEILEARASRRAGGPPDCRATDEDGAARVKACLARHGESSRPATCSAPRRERRPSRDLLELSGHRTASARFTPQLADRPATSTASSSLWALGGLGGGARHDRDGAPVAGRPTRPRRRCGAIFSTWPSPCGAGCSRGDRQGEPRCALEDPRGAMRAASMTGRSTNSVVRPPGIVDNIGADLVDLEHARARGGHPNPDPGRDDHV